MVKLLQLRSVVISTIMCLFLTGACKGLQALALAILFYYSEHCLHYIVEETICQGKKKYRTGMP